MVFTDVSGLPEYYSENFGHLPVKEGLDAFLEDDRRRKRKERTRALPYARPPLVPARKELPKVPTRHNLPIKPKATIHPVKRPEPALPSLLDRICLEPIVDPVHFNYDLKGNSAIAVADKRVTACIIRINAVFECEQFNTLSRAQVLKLDFLADRLNWLTDHIDVILNWKPIDRSLLYNGCAAIGRINFKQLRKRYSEVVSELVKVEDGHFFDRCNPCDRFDHLFIPNTGASA